MVQFCLSTLYMNIDMVVPVREKRNAARLKQSTQKALVERQRDDAC
jgi:hypothetical protein